MSVRFVRPAFFLVFSVSEPEAQRGERCRRGKGDNGHQHIAARVLPNTPHAAVCPRTISASAAPASAVNNIRQKAERRIASRRCLRRVFSRTRCLTSATRFAVSYISFEPPFRFVWNCDKNPFTYIGTKNQKNSHPKRKIFQKNLRAAKKQLSGSGYSVISSARGGKRTAFPPPPAAPAGRRPRTAPRRRGR